jgi:hypothetical protein
MMAEVQELINAKSVSTTLSSLILANSATQKNPNRAARRAAKKK